MKFVGIILVVVGITMLLVNSGVVAAVTWSIIWPVILIALGLASSVDLKGKLFHGMCGGCGSKMCGGCDKGSEEHKCEGATCKVCNK